MVTKEGLRGARKQAGLTQTQAASLVGVGRRAWQTWEWGERTINQGLVELFLIKTGQHPEYKRRQEDV